MSKKRNYKLFLVDILSSIRKIEKYTCNLSLEQFLNNDLIVDAVIRNLEVVGEAVKKLPPEIIEKYSNVPWREIAGFRDVLIHGYFGVDRTVVWKTVTVLKEQIEVILKKEFSA